MWWIFNVFRGFRGDAGLCPQVPNPSPPFPTPSLRTPLQIAGLNGWLHKSYIYCTMKLYIEPHVHLIHITPIPMTPANGFWPDGAIWADSTLTTPSTQDEKDVAAKSRAPPSPPMMDRGYASSHIQTRNFLCYICLTILLLLAVMLAALLNLRIGS